METISFPDTEAESIRNPHCALHRTEVTIFKMLWTILIGTTQLILISDPTEHTDDTFILTVSMMTHITKG